LRSAAIALFTVERFIPAMAEEEKDPNAAKGETPLAGASSPANSGEETTTLPDQPDAEQTGSDQKPKISEAAQQPELANPNAGTAHTPTVSEENAPSTDEAVATPLPSANKPDMEPTGPGGRAPSRATKAGTAEVQGEEAGLEKASAPEGKPASAKKGAEAAEGKPAARAKKERPPAVEDKPFADFINQDLLPSLTKTMANQGINDLKLEFVKQPLPVRGADDTECWQVIGRWNNNQREFIIGFLKEDINAQKVFCWADNGAKPSLLESFMIDERKVSLDLLLLYVVQRLNAQKWLVMN